MHTYIHIYIHIYMYKHRCLEVYICVYTYMYMYLKSLQPEVGSVVLGVGCGFWAGAWMLGALGKS